MSRPGVPLPGSRRTPRCVAGPQHGLEVIDDASARAHAVAGDDDGRACGLCEVFDDAHVFVMAVDGDELLERQRLAAFLRAMTGVFVPVALQLLVGGGEAAGERRVEDDGKLRPVDIGVAILARSGASTGVPLASAASRFSWRISSSSNSSSCVRPILNDGMSTVPGRPEPAQWPPATARGGARDPRDGGRHRYFRESADRRPRAVRVRQQR